MIQNTVKQPIDYVLNFSTNNRINYNNLLKDYKNGSNIVPFIGDSLSEFAFGSGEQWISELIEDAEDGIVTLVEQKKGSGLMAMLKTLDTCGFQRKSVEKALTNYYQENKIDDRLLLNQPISMIPYLSKGVCITNGMNRVLDHAYKLAGKHPEILSPFNHKKTYSIMQGHNEFSSDEIIIKLHGEMGTDSNEIILTQDEYNKHYQPDSEFYRFLSGWTKKHIILFIGDEITKDGYLYNLVKDIKEAGMYHYAIIPSSNDENMQKELLDKLYEISIYPILYDVSAHDNLSTLLHKLLVDLNNADAFNYPKKRIDYRYSQHNLIGRDAERTILSSLLNSTVTEEKHKDYFNKDFLWTVLIGDQCSGKSRLVLDFLQQYTSGWDWYCLDPEDIMRFINEQLYLQNKRLHSRKLIVVFDNFDYYAGDLLPVFNFINQLDSSKTTIVRYVFILNDFDDSPLYKILSLQGRDELWWKMRVSLFEESDFVFADKLEAQDVVDICHEFIIYLANQLGTTKKILMTEVFPSINDELCDFVKEQIQINSIEYLDACQLKALNLVKAYFGESKLSNTEISELLNRITIAYTNSLLKDALSSDLDVDKLDNDSRLRIDQIKQMKNHYENQEIYTEFDKSTDEISTVHDDLNNILRTKSQKGKAELTTIENDLINDNQRSQDNKNENNSVAVKAVPLNDDNSKKE